jgi:hypothetical protein
MSISASYVGSQTLLSVSHNPACNIAFDLAQRSFYYAGKLGYVK